MPPSFHTKHAKHELAPNAHDTMQATGAIIYQSKYGSTEQFARWLRDDTGFDLFRLNKLPLNLSAYRTLVIGSRIHSERLALGGWITSHWDSIRNSRLILMVTSASNDSCFLNKVMQDSLPADVLAHFAVFFVGGQYIFDRMSLFDRALIKIAARFETKPGNKAGILTERDDLRRLNLRHVITHIKSTDRQNVALGWFSTPPPSRAEPAV